VQRQVADSIVSVHGAGLRFDHDSGCWHRFQGWAWGPLPKSVKAGFHLAERWAAVNEHLLKPGDFKAVTKANFYNGVEDILRQRLVVRQVDFDRDAWLLGCPGGTVDLRTGALRPALASDFISRTCAVTPVDFENCPRFKKFLHEICKGDAGMILFLQQWFGYCLTGDTTEQVFLFLYGPGGNGKSVLVDTLAWVAGTYFVKPVEDLYIKKSLTRHMEAVAMLAGARMAVISEVPSGSQWDEGRLKEHTGGGLITANYMRQNSFSFTPQFKLTALGNHQPTFPGGFNPAIRRRFKMMLLDFTPKVADKTLEKVFQGEGPGILRWAINGLCGAKTGWHKTGLMVPQSVETTTDEYVADQDVFAAWLGDRTEKRLGALTAVEAVFRDWTEYRNAHDSQVEGTLRLELSPMRWINGGTSEKGRKQSVVLPI
jgi:putative DNA primase/helicase